MSGLSWYGQLPVNLPKSQVNNYSQDGAGRCHFNAASVPVYAPNSVGGQAGAMFREVFNNGEKARLPETVSGVKNADIKERAIGYWTNVDADFGAKLRANLGATPLSDAEAANKIG